MTNTFSSTRYRPKFHFTSILGFQRSVTKKICQSGHSDIHRSMKTSHIFGLWENAFRRTTSPKARAHWHGAEHAQFRNVSSHIQGVYLIVRSHILLRGSGYTTSTIIDPLIHWILPEQWHRNMGTPRLPHR